MDAVANFAYSTLIAAPSPATSGTSLTPVMASGWPATPFNAVLWPADDAPRADNAEIVRCTNISILGVWTIDRAQESTTARSVAVGWNIAANITQKWLDDLVTLIGTKLASSGTAADVNPAGTSIAAALSAKLGATAQAADVDPAGTAIAAALAGKAATNQKLDDFGAPDDNTDLNATQSVHGLMSKLDKAKLDNDPITIGFAKATAATGDFDFVFVVPAACTLVSWAISVDAGTCTVKFWKKATGTTIPTSGDSINTSGVSISTGTHVSSTTLTDFTTTAFAAGDLVRATATAVSGTTWIAVQLKLTRN